MRDATFEGEKHIPKFEFWTLFTTPNFEKVNPIWVLYNNQSWSHVHALKDRDYADFVTPRIYMGVMAQGKPHAQPVLILKEYISNKTPPPTLL